MPVNPAGPSLARQNGPRHDKDRKPSQDAVQGRLAASTLT